MNWLRRLRRSLLCLVLAVVALSTSGCFVPPELALLALFAEQAQRIEAAPGTIPPAATETPPLHLLTGEPLPDPDLCDGSSEPTQRDIERALTYFSDLDFSMWERSYTVESTRVSVTWISDDYGALIHLEHLLYPCGYSQQSYNEYFGERARQAILLSSYENLVLINECAPETEHLRLYELTGEVNSIEYDLLMRTDLDSPTRIIYTVMVFSSSRRPALEAYAEADMPALNTCADQ